MKRMTYLMLFLAFSACLDVAAEEYDAVVGVTLGESLPSFHTIREAVAAAPPIGPYRVWIREGIYREKLDIVRADVHLYGAGREATIISWDDTGSTLGSDSLELGTWGSATVTVRAPGFRAENMTIENSFDYPANAALPEDDPRRVEHMQAVALMTTGDSDRAVFRNVTIRGYQDTLFIDAGRQWFHGCRVEGHVDFIFGAGQAVFEQCDIISRNRSNKNPTGYVTAPSTLESEAHGFLFLESRFLKEEGVPAASVRLGRPWHPNANPLVNGSAVFMRCFMDDHIGPEGYAPISSVNADGERIWFEVDEQSRFFEFENHGPGALESDQRPRLTPARAKRFTPTAVLSGWKPAERTEAAESM